MLNTQCLIEGLKVLASKEEQRRLWLPNDSNEMSLFDEDVCYVFDDSHLSKAVDRGWLSKNCSEEFCETVRKLKKAISYVPAELAPEALMEHPRMDDVRQLSQELLALVERAQQQGRNP